MSEAHFTIAVVGAGPAGASAANALCLGGVHDVALIDRARFPRDKTCGDGITEGAADALKELRSWPFARGARLDQASGRHGALRCAGGTGARRGRTTAPARLCHPPHDIRCSSRQHSASARRADLTGQAGQGGSVRWTMVARIIGRAAGPAAAADQRRFPDRRRWCRVPGPPRARASPQFRRAHLDRHTPRSPFAPMPGRRRPASH